MRVWLTSLDIENSSKSRRIDGDRRTLAIDIGGTFIKTAMVDADGALISEFVTTPTPKPATPEMVIALIARVIKPLPEFGRISVGFPGVVHRDAYRDRSQSRDCSTGKILTSSSARHLNSASRFAF